MDVKARIRRYFDEVVAEPVGDEEDVFELGIVDSLFAIQLVAFVEGTFSIVAEREDLDIRNFCSIAALAAFVESKLRRTTDAEPMHEHPAD